jgi:hypothetical protein
MTERIQNPNIDDLSILLISSEQRLFLASSPTCSFKTSLDKPTMGVLTVTLEKVLNIRDKDRVGKQSVIESPRRACLGRIQAKAHAFSSVLLPFTFLTMRRLRFLLYQRVSPISTTSSPSFVASRSNAVAFFTSSHPKSIVASRSWSDAHSPYAR